MSDSSDWEADDAIFTSLTNRDETRNRRKNSGKALALLGIEHASPTKRRSTRSSTRLSIGHASSSREHFGKAHALLGIEQPSPAKERFSNTLPLRRHGALGSVRRWVDKSLPPTPSSSHVDTPVEMYAKHVVHDTSRRGSRIRWSSSDEPEAEDFENGMDEVQEVIRPGQEHADRKGAAEDALQSWVNWVSSAAAGIALETRLSGEYLAAVEEVWGDDEVDADGLYSWYEGFGFEDAVCVFEPEEDTDDDGDSIIIGFP